VNGKPQFQYHQQSIDYIKEKLGELPIGNAEIGHIGQLDNNDQQKTELSLEQGNWSWGWELNPGQSLMYQISALFPQPISLFSFSRRSLTERSILERNLSARK